MLDEGSRNRYKRDEDLAAGLAQTRPQWEQIDEMEALETEFLANNAAAQEQYVKLTAKAVQDDAELKSTTRTEGIDLAMQVGRGLLSWATSKGEAQADLKAALEKKLKRSMFDHKDELDYAKLVSWVYGKAEPVKAELEKYFVPAKTTDKLGALHLKFDGMRGNGQLTRTEAAGARKLLKAALSRNDRKKTGVIDRLRVYVNNFQYGEPEHQAVYELLTRLMLAVDRRGRPRQAPPTAPGA